MPVANPDFFKQIGRDTQVSRVPPEEQVQIGEITEQDVILGALHQVARASLDSTVEVGSDPGKIDQFLKQVDNFASQHLD